MKFGRNRYIRVMFPQLNYPQCELRIQEKNGTHLVWDDFRKKELVLTREEWVRQHIVHYLVNHLNYPKGRIVLEQTIKQNGMNKRCDVVVYNKMGNPELIIECKEPRVDITEETFYQIARYKSVLQVPFLVMSNGISTIICEVKNGNIEYLKEYPSIS